MARNSSGAPAMPSTLVFCASLPPLGMSQSLANLMLAEHACVCCLHSTPVLIKKDRWAEM